MDDTLAVRVVKDAGKTVLKLSGDLDSYTSSQLSKFDEEWLSDVSELVVNMNGLDYIDSTGLSAMVTLWTRCRDRKIPMSIYCRNPRVYRVFEITGLLNLFTFVADGPVIPVDQAVAPRLKKVRGQTVPAPDKPGTHPS
ncbi:MAG: STAS domain-containing protein [Armatimonadetes bacterium]|nr:STAS domain-containing protein [Armatimonadota bacterium]